MYHEVGCIIGQRNILDTKVYGEYLLLLDEPARIEVTHYGHSMV